MSIVHTIFIYEYVLLLLFPGEYYVKQTSLTRTHATMEIVYDARCTFQIKSYERNYSAIEVCGAARTTTARDGRAGGCGGALSKTDATQQITVQADARQC